MLLAGFTTGAFIEEENMKKIVSLLVLTVLIRMSAFCDRPPAQAYDIPSLLLRVRDAVYDVNRDGEVNCLDYATTFKYIWDRSFPASDCELVRNYNTRTGMNHIFARVRFSRYSRWQLVETWAHDVYFYDVPSIWGSKYDPAYNYYDETSYWMRDVGYWR